MKWKANVALITVIMIVCILLVLGTSTILSNIDFARSSQSFFKATSAKADMVSCFEEGLNKVSEDKSFVGQFTVDLAGVECTVNAEDDVSPGVKILTLQTISGDYTSLEVKKVDTNENPLKVLN